MAHVFGLCFFIKLNNSKDFRNNFEEKQMQQSINEWNSANITQFELSKLIYTSGFLTAANLTATTKLVLMALIQHYNANNADMFPSQKFLAKQLGISEKSVERSIANLKNEDFIYYETKRVNRYRFTAKFFEQIKMSVMNRQNVGNDVRQNVGQTNNMEKINKKDYFLNFEGEIFSQVAKSQGTGAKAPQNSINLKDFRTDKSYQSSNIMNVSPAVHFQNFTGCWQENQAQREKDELERKRFLEKNRETFDDFSIVIGIRDITLRILPHSPLLKLYWLEEYGCVKNIVKDLCEELYNNNKLEQLHRDYKRVYDCSENLTQKTVEIAQNTIKGVYEAKQKINRSLVQKVLYSSMLINGQRVRIYHKDFLENPAVLTELFEK